MTALAMKSKGTWLNWSVWAGDVQPKSRVKPAAEPKIAIRPARQITEYQAQLVQES